jgi:glycosyltransferase involved in cell wall biosynthesis
MSRDSTYDSTTVGDTPLVSALISTYNRAGFIEEAVRSVLAQTMTDLECIVVDDGSTDDTEQRLTSEFGDRIRYHKQPNGGAASARNTAVDMATGHYLAFLDSDDLWTEDHLAVQLQCFEEEPKLGLVYGEYHSYEGDTLVGTFPRREAPSGMAFAGLLSASLVQTSTTMVPADVARANGKFNEAYRIGDEYDFFLRISAHHPIRFLQQKLVTYRVHGTNISRDPITFNRDMLTIYRDLLAGDAVPAEHQRLLVRRVSRYEFNVARILEQADDKAAAHEHYAKALQHRFWMHFPKPHLGWWRTRGAVPQSPKTAPPTPEAS